MCLSPVSTFIYLPPCLSDCLFVCSFIFLLILYAASVYRYICLPLCLFILLSMYFFCLKSYMSFFVSVSLPIRFLVPLSADPLYNVCLSPVFAFLSVPSLVCLSSHFPHRLFSRFITLFENLYISLSICGTIIVPFHQVSK